MHSLGIYHGDVSLNNVLFCSDGVKLIDFGLAGRISDMDGVFGKPMYMAPEMKEEKALSELIDVYSAGVVIAEWINFMRTNKRSKSIEEFNTNYVISQKDVDEKEKWIFEVLKYCVCDVHTRKSA